MVEGSGAERRYEENGKECGQRRKDVSQSRGGDEVVGLSSGWAGRAQCSLEPYEPSRVGQRESEGVCNCRRMKKTQLRWRNKERVHCNVFVSCPRMCGAIFFFIVFLCFSLTSCEI